MSRTEYDDRSDRHRESPDVAKTNFIFIVADDLDGRPHDPKAFLTAPGQGVNYRRGTWHGVLTPLHEPGLFAVVDRIGPGENLEEHWFDEPYEITRTGD